MQVNSSLYECSVSNPFHLNQSPGMESRSYCPALVVMAILQYRQDICKDRQEGKNIKQAGYYVAWKYQ